MKNEFCQNVAACLQDAAKFCGQVSNIAGLSSHSASASPHPTSTSDSSVGPSTKPVEVAIQNKKKKKELLQKERSKVEMEIAEHHIGKHV